MKRQNEMAIAQAQTDCIQDVFLMPLDLLIELLER